MQTPDRISRVPRAVPSLWKSRSGDARACIRRAGTIQRHQNAVAEVLDVIRRDPSAPLTVETLARVANMSHYHFLRTFEEVTGVTPHRFITALRMEQAKRLLLEQTLAVTAICFEVGYNSLGTFTRLFVEYVGTTPKRFRKFGASFGQQPLEWLVTGYFAQQRSRYTKGTISGFVWAPAKWCGAIFVGAFGSSVPERLPIDGTLLVQQGRFELALPSLDRTYCVMAAGFPSNSTIAQCLVPAQHDLLVASSVIRQGRDELTSRRELTLRKPHMFDPPIVTALPLLLNANPYQANRNSGEASRQRNR